jgi:hypothetical protein
VTDKTKAKCPLIFNLGSIIKTNKKNYEFGSETRQEDLSKSYPFFKIV